MNLPSSISGHEDHGVRRNASRRSILVVDDHPMMRAGLVHLLDRQPDLQVTGEAGDPAEALKLLAKMPVDLIITDVSMPGKGGLELIKDLHALHPKVPVLVLSMHDESIYAERVARCGARGYIMKETGGERMLEAVRQVLAGAYCFSPAILSLLLNGLGDPAGRNSQSPFARLTDREMEVFQLVGQGKSTRDIARALNLSPKTVDVHRGHIKAKLELHDTTALIRYAVRWTEAP